MMRRFLRIVTSAAVALASLALTMPEASANSCTVQTTRVGDRTVITYTTGNSSTCFQTFTAPAHVNHISVLVVGGGGGGGFDAGGGGGGGGQGYATRLNLVANATYNITVGSGGVPGTNSNRTGETGTSSAFSLPGTTQLVGLGGIGGGGCSWNGTSCQAMNGGGAGGGTTTGTFTMTSSTGSTSGGNGGNGYYYSLSGFPVSTPSSRTLGTAGTARDMGLGSVTYGSGGDGGPGTGVSSTPTANSGGGGGGGTSNTAGNSGANGIVIVSYVVAICAPTQTLNASLQTTLIFTTVGQCTYEVPSGISSLAVEVVGGGGGGGFDSGGGGGGGGYGYSASLSVSSGETITMLVGVGGGGGISTRKIGISGGTSSFKGISATGGSGGNGCTYNGTNCNLSNSGGAGGSSSGATTNTSGKTGGNGYCYTSGANACGTAPAITGQVGTSGVLDTATVYGGSGGGNGDVVGAAGTGQGGGGGVADGTGGIGRAGGSGRVVIRFSTAACSPTSYTSSDGTRQIYRFTSIIDCYWTVPALATTANILIVGGGGGGGGDAGGGGGGGGVIYKSGYSLTPGKRILISIGRGGTPGTSSPIANDGNVAFSGLNGGQTIFDTFTAPGGGGGGGKNSGGLNGASGGGAGHAASPFAAGGSGTFNADIPSAPAGPFGGATADNGNRGTGGGGALSNGSGSTSGAGGTGYTSSISETSTVYGGGGGGGTHNSATASSSGCSGGGAGGTNAVAGQDGLANTGCGGGGSGNAGSNLKAGNGANGVVFVSVLKVTQSLVAANQPANQSWNAVVASDARFGNAMKAISSAGETVTASSSTTSICTVDASGLLTKITPGTCTLNYSHPGTSTYQSWSYNYSFNVVRATPTFATWNLSSQNYGASFILETPTIVTSSPGTFAYTSANSSIVSFNAGTSRWTANAVGTTTMTANYTPTNTTLWETSTLTTSITISKSARTISFAATSLSKTYGDATFSVSASPSLGSGDGSITYIASGGGCSVNSSGTVTILTAGSCTINASISSGASYDTATTTTPVTVTIARKTLSISAASIASKVYDGTRNPGALSVGALSGLVSGESLTVTGSAAQLSSQNADTYTVVVTYTLGNGSGGGLASNYSLASDSATAVVTKKALTVTASNASVAYGDNVPAISYSYSGFIASENATYVSQAPTCTTTYTALSAANTTPATSCSGASATNYSFTYVSGTVTISKVTLTVTASSHSVNYGATAPTITSTITGFKNSQTASVIATPPTCTTNYTNTSPAGSYYTRCSGGSDTNYDFTYVDGAVTVSSVSRTVSLSVASSTLTYGDTTTATFSMTGDSSDGTLSLSVTSGSCSVVGSTIRATAGTGTCTVRVTASGAVSYQDTYTAVSISLQKKSLTVTGTSIASRAYNGSTTAGTVSLGTLSGFVGSDSLNFSANVANYSSANVGTYSTTVIYTLISTPNGVSSNYQVSDQTISGQITAVSLTVTAPNFSRHFSQAVPSPITPVITGFVNSETSSALSVVPTCSTTYTTSSSVGSNQSTSCSGGSATNYSFTYVNGTVTVTTLVRTIEITASRTTLIYGESTSISVTPSIGSSDGVISVTVSGGGCSFGADSTTVVATDPTQACSVGASITGGINYNDATAAPVSISLQKKTLTISGLRTQPKVYDGSILVPLTGGTLNGVINSDSVTATYSARFLDKSVGASKPVTSLSSISGAAASRYVLTQPTLTSETITAATLTVSGLSAVSRPANGSRSAQIAGTPQLVGLVAGDTVTVINFSSGLFETSTAGDSITVITTMTIIGGDSANYTLTLPTLVANITVSYDNIITFAEIPNVEIGSTAIILTPTVTSGLVITLTLVGTACNLVGTTLSFVDLGSCSITASQPGNQGSGGTFPAATSVVRTFSVIARSITISADSKTFNVGGQMTPTFKVSGGLLSGDRIASVTFRYSGNGVSNSSTVPSSAGTYSIAPSLAVFSQRSRSTYYSITYTQGALVILDSTVKALTSLKVSPAGGGTTDLLNGLFSNSIDSYTVRINYSVSSVILFLERSNTTNVNAQVRINDSGWRTLKWSGITGGSTDSGLVPVPTRISSVQVRLYGNDKESDRETRIISISIYRDEASKAVPNPSDTSTVMPTFESRTAEVPLPANAAVSAISFSPTVNFGFFNPNVDSYTAVVARKISAISAVTNFTGNGITVRISVNNGPYKVIPSTGASPTYALSIGPNILVVRVSSLDGSISTYLFSITRQSS